MNVLSPWRAHVSRRTGRMYYYNRETRVSTYVKPVAASCVTRSERPEKRRRVESGEEQEKEPNVPNEPTLGSVFSNPHIRQVLQPTHGYSSLLNMKFERVLRNDAPGVTYRRRQGEYKTVIHWGQRKLLLSEVEFLSMYGVAGATVVYAGAAPGTHTWYLIELFPELKFVLVDPAPFSDRLSEGPRCVLRQEMFTDDVAREFAGRGDVLFICDVRSCDWCCTSDVTVEKKVLEDMESQQRWHDIIRPIKSMLKFRLPWTPGETEYLAGDVYFQAFGPVTTTETRLIPHGHERVTWDNRTYEEQMFYFNTVTRVARYAHGMPVGRRGYGIDYCYDCRCEVDILSGYLIKVRPELRDDTEGLQREFVRMTYQCSRECAPTRTLLDVNSDPEEKYAGIQKRQWIREKPAYHEDNVHPKPFVPVYSSVAKDMMAKMGYAAESAHMGYAAESTHMGYAAESTHMGYAAESTQSAQSIHFRRRGIGF